MHLLFDLDGTLTDPKQGIVTCIRHALDGLGVEIEAGELADVIAIPRTALRDGDRLWAVDASNTLQIHETELRWVDGETLLVNNTLAPGEKLIVSGLRAALPGMEVDPQPAPDSTPWQPSAPPSAGRRWLDTSPGPWSMDHLRWPIWSTKSWPTPSNTWKSELRRACSPRPGTPTRGQPF